MKSLGNTKTNDSFGLIREENVKNREKIIAQLKSEFIGGGTLYGLEIDCSGEIYFEKTEAYKPYIQHDTKEEIIQSGSPLRRYGAAILFPTDKEKLDEENEISEIGKLNENENKEELIDLKEIEKLENRYTNYNRETHDDFDITTANSYRQNSMAISFKAEINNQSNLIIHVTGGRYTPKNVYIEGKEREWWLRHPIEGSFSCSGRTLLQKQINSAEPLNKIEGLDLDVKIISRLQDDGTRLFTVSLTNRSIGTGNKKLDSLCLFQSAFSVTIEQPNDESPKILPYPEGDIFENLDNEEKSIALLYRKLKTYAIGHGCAADWGKVSEEKVFTVNTEFFPTYETKSMTPDITREDNSKIEVSMKKLAGLDPSNDGFQELEEIVFLYRRWIEKQKIKIATLNSKFIEVANANLKNCEESADRMERGLNYLKNDTDALKAFRLANHAVLLQQITGQRRSGFIQDDSLVFDSIYEEPNIDSISETKGKWRAFQIAFLLMSVNSVGQKDSEERNIIDLIFFPTGGGKTEAYLGLAAFTMFMRRIKNKQDCGVDVLMRYTLRLLTADQFQRSSRLICAMEILRRKHIEILGTEEFSIGIWLGGETTPNSNDDAIKALKNINSGKSENNPFILSSCPWCGAELGNYKIQNTRQSFKNRTGNKRINNRFKFLGYKGMIDRVIIHCPDNKCKFSDKLPIYLVDEEIYKVRPTFIIGTVDKFAMLAWKPEIRSLFGINDAGQRNMSPPGLIIQDELHLISGPLGSMTGFFETIIDELCTDKRNEIHYKPKIVCSTATIRRYKEQVKSLYAREEVRLFPASALDEDDSFFATYAVDKKGEYMPGRKYVGINSPALGSMQTLQVRALTSLLQAPMTLPEDMRDPWWTLLIFFNSLRELGTTITLLHSDIPNHLKLLQNRLGINFEELRKLKKIEELTSRLSNDEVSVAIDKLKQSYDDTGKVTDISLASNIIEVGIDIDRLSLMSVVGQPKTTAQYIQVTGRVGRRWYQRPGLIVTLYSASKPRDRSHFEKFRSYHQMLYAQVEPTSVTPFSPKVIDRALHALMIAYVRQNGDKHVVNTPRPFPEKLINEIENVILNRVNIVDPAEVENVKNVFARKRREWERREPLKWSGNPDNEDYPLMRIAGQYADQKAIQRSWPTMTSMRNVDAQCRGEISDSYIEFEEE
ncbi:helicase-related protein [Fictibacillus nanhaiensis]|uniref:helicase-related protein n=1 Tax=Fictibacillus nanhaiensis TaxID=742169 RepID=UPI003C28831B